MYNVSSIVHVHSVYCPWPHLISEVVADFLMTSPADMILLYTEGAFA